jgi:hypothetical protein
MLDGCVTPDDGAYCLKVQIRMALTLDEQALRWHNRVYAPMAITFLLILWIVLYLLPEMTVRATAALMIPTSLAIVAALAARFQILQAKARDPNRYSRLVNEANTRSWNTLVGRGLFTVFVLVVAGSYVAILSPPRFSWWITLLFAVIAVAASLSLVKYARAVSLKLQQP